jgi:hypothetical protein
VVFVDAASLADTVAKIVEVLHVLEGDAVTLNRNPKCEPQLGRRGLYATLGGHGGKREMEYALLWVLNLSDGSHSLLDVAERSGLSFSLIRTAADTLIHHELLVEVPAAVTKNDADRIGCESGLSPLASRERSARGSREESESSSAAARARGGGAPRA